MARPETVVDYEAWKRGYMPPSEHILIDQLAYRGARVVMSSDWAEHGAFWIVMRGKTKTTPAMRKAMREMLEMMFEASLGTGSENAPGPAQSDTPSPVRELSDGPDNSR